MQDLLFWGTAEVNYVRFGDGFVQSSSIMPQKRNPVAIEHARAIGSKALGQAHAIALAVHNTPFGDIVDTEDDLQPLVWSMFSDATRAVRLVAAAMQTATFDAARLEARAGHGGTTMTELSDTLVREHGLPFKTAHAIAGRVLKARAQQSGRAADRDARRGMLRAGRPTDSVQRGAAARDPEPAVFRHRAAHAGRSGAGGDRACRGAFGCHPDRSSRVGGREPGGVVRRAAGTQGAERGAVIDDSQTRP